MTKTNKPIDRLTQKKERLSNQNERGDITLLPLKNGEYWETAMNNYPPTNWVN